MNGSPRARITVVGDVGLDVWCRLTAPLAPGDDTPARITAHPGGAGGNTAAWLADLGVQVDLIARVGDDEAGRTAAAELTARGVSCRFGVDARHPTCRVVVLIGPDGDRTMVSDRGANAALHPDDIHLTELGRPGHLHLSGYVLLDEASRPAGRTALARAAAAGWSTSVDPQTAAGVGAVGAATFLGWVRGVDLLLPNDAELAALGGPAAALAAARAVAVTHGRDGATWFAGAERRQVPVERVDDTDSTGAGDAFNAGLLAAWVRGADPTAALTAGVRAGTRASGADGARSARGRPLG